MAPPVGSDPREWVALPPFRPARWLIPRTPRVAAREGLRLYRPLTRKGLLGWQAARAVAGLGAFRYLGGRTEPPAEVIETLAPHTPSGGTFALSNTNHAGKWLALIVDADGGLRSVAKLATDPVMRDRLATEGRALTTLAPHLSGPLSGPRVLLHEPGLLLLEVVAWRPAPRPWELPEEVAYALGSFYRQGAVDEQRSRGYGHGDFAPWNVLRTRAGWTVLDWEHADEQARPFGDVLHYATMSHSLLGRPSRDDILMGLDGEGPIGRAIGAYARAAGLPLDDLRDLFVGYLKSRDRLAGATRSDRMAMRARHDLLAAIGGGGS